MLNIVVWKEEKAVNENDSSPASYNASISQSHERFPKSAEVVKAGFYEGEPVLTVDGLVKAVNHEIYENAIGRNVKEDLITTLERVTVAQGILKQPVDYEEMREFVSKLYNL